MADNTSDNVGGVVDGEVKPVADAQALFEKYAEEAASHPKYIHQSQTSFWPEHF